MLPVVILGSGLAGITVARELRKLDQETPLAIVTADDGTFYSKPNLSNACTAGKSAAQLALTPAAQLAAQLGVEIVPHTPVSRVLPAQRVLETATGQLVYDRLVLAVGAHPIRLALAGDGAAEVLSVNNLSDYAGFREKLAGKQRVAILGAGLIGCEFANDLRSIGIAVEVFDLSPQPLGRLLPTQAAVFLRERLEAAGVRFHFETSLVAVDKHGAGYRLTDSQGAVHTADLVLSAVGLKPATELASAAGLTVNRGIVTDRQLRTSDPHIYSLGDCAEVQGLVLPFVLPIMQAARALAKTLAGAATEVVYPAMPVVVKTPACPTVVCPPPQGSQGAWREESSAVGVRALFEDGAGNLLGFALLGGDAVKEKTALAARLPAWL